MCVCVCVCVCARASQCSYMQQITSLFSCVCASQQGVNVRRHQLPHQPRPAVSQEHRHRWACEHEKKVRTLHFSHPSCHAPCTFHTLSMHSSLPSADSHECLVQNVMLECARACVHACADECNHLGSVVKKARTSASSASTLDRLRHVRDVVSDEEGMIALPPAGSRAEGKTHFTWKCWRARLACGSLVTRTSSPLHEHYKHKHYKPLAHCGLPSVSMPVSNPSPTPIFVVSWSLCAHTCLSCLYVKALNQSIRA